MISTDVAALIATQDGVISLAQAMARGMSADRVERLVAAKQWVRLYPGVFRSVQHRSSHAARLRAAVLVTRGVASGPSAAWWHGISELAPTRPTVTISAKRRIDSPPGIRVRHRTLDREDICVERGLWVTAVELAAIEVNDSTVLDRVLQNGISLDRLKEVHARNGKRRGSAQAGRLLTVAESGGRSEAERILHRLLEPIPGWQAQYRVGTYFLDAGFPDVLVGIEVDGWRWHKDVERNRRDQQRHNQLEIAGWLMLRFDWHRLTNDADGVVDEIRRALAARR